LIVQQHPNNINNMLEAAASTALKMPKLKPLEIWNGQARSAALFRYQFKHRGYAVLNRKSTWKFTLQPRVVKAWKAVAYQAAPYSHISDNLFLVEESLDETRSIESHADAINYLKLLKVLRPVSLQQILTEDKMRNETIVPQGRRIARPKPTGIHKKRSFSGKYWSKAIRYRSKIRDQCYMGAMSDTFWWG
jgi:hypothetical protein